MTDAMLHFGDCLPVLRGMADNSLDACVTDPPYGLSFMGKGWDYDVPSVDIWREVFRVLKPGAHLLAFAGTRTQHRMAVNIEDAGFEIRDMIAWVYGSGFPKSLDVSKAIDKQRTEDAEPVRVICRAVRAAMDARGLKSKHLVEYFDGCHPRLIDHWAARDTDSQPSLPTWEQWVQLCQVVGLSDELDAEVWRLNGRKGQPGDTWQTAEVIGHHDGSTPGFGDHRFSVRDTAIRETSDAARKWQGWGTALKPALEPITVARKPLVGTVAANVQTHGTGALNIDGCRIEGVKGVPASPRRAEQGTAYGDLSNDPGSGSGWNPNVGRWPANLIHDGSEEVLAGFPQAGGGFGKRGGNKNSTSYGFAEGSMETVGYGNSGSAARFFYCPKASKADRDEGCDALLLKRTAKLGGADNDREDLDPVSERFRTAPSRNNHPTVKPTDLMRYLCRLVTPPGGVVLDPFMGSGSTGKAATLEGFAFIGIEREAEYLEIARARIGNVKAKPKQEVLL